MIDRQMAKPIPMPLGLVVNRGLKIRSMIVGSIPFPVSATEISTPSRSWIADLIRKVRGDAFSVQVEHEGWSFYATDLARSFPADCEDDAEGEGQCTPSTPVESWTHCYQHCAALPAMQEVLGERDIRDKGAA